MTQDIVARCVDAARTFGQGAAAVVAVHGTSCEVRQHDRVAIEGPSGSGKSTLLHLLAGLESPTSGRVSWPLLEASNVSPAQHIGVVFQSPSLVPALDVAENVALPLLLAGVAEPEAAERTNDALQRVSVLDLAAKLPEELSGGQAQRVAVARVIAMRPQLVLADEPTGQLDQVTGQHVIDVLLDAVEEIGAALVVSTHDRAIADRLEQRWVMHEGRLLVSRRAPRGDVIPDRRHAS